MLGEFFKLDGREREREGGRIVFQIQTLTRGLGSDASRCQTK
jgi:hypothetical protein